VKKKLHIDKMSVDVLLFVKMTAVFLNVVQKCRVRESGQPRDDTIALFD
jgi:hypothetical protein